MLHFLLRRIAKRPDGIVSKLYDDAGDFCAVTLEHSYDGEPKVPPGSYVCKRGKHSLYDRRLKTVRPPFETFEVTGVPGHTGILFHTGNWHTDSEGCILVGRVGTESTEGFMVTNSRLTFGRLMDLLSDVNMFQLTVTDEHEV